MNNKEKIIIDDEEYECLQAENDSLKSTNNFTVNQLKELIREVVREELTKLNYGFIPDVKPSHTIDIQSVSVYACPIMETNEKITLTINTEDIL